MKIINKIKNSDFIFFIQGITFDAIIAIMFLITVLYQRYLISLL